MTRSRDLYTGPADVQDAFRSLNDDLQKVRENAIIPGRLIKDRAFVAGDNTILHGLGRLPEMWHVSRPRGSFSAPGGGGGGGAYPMLPKYKVSYAQDNPSSNTTTLSFTMGSAPAEGSVIVAAIYRDSTEALSVVNSISQTGVTWSEGQAVPGNGSANALMLWIGDVGSGASASGTINFATSATYESGVILVELTEAASATPDGKDSGYTTTNNSFSTSDILTEPSATAGDILVKAGFFYTTNSSSYPPRNSNWFNCVGSFEITGATGDQIGVWLGVAPHDNTYPMLRHGYNGITEMWYSLAFPSSISAGGGSSNVPHGLREVSRSKDTLVLNALTAFTADLWVA